MKYLILSFFVILFVTPFFAQAPQAFNYQGVARDLSGTPLPNQTIGLRMSILENSPNGTEVYQETHNATTTDLGLFSLQIGNGNVTIGVFEDIDWGSGSRFLQIEIDENGGSNFQLIGTSELLSVPYALFAENAGDSFWNSNINGINYSDGNVGIGTNSPNNRLEVSLDSTGDLFGEGIELNRNNGSLKMFNGTTLLGEFQPRISGVSDSDISPGLTMVGTPSLINSNARGILFRAGETAHMFAGNLFEFDNFSNTLFVVDYRGFLGVGTTQPNAKIQVSDGDVYIEDINNGVVMKSPNGQCWRYPPDN